MACVKFNNYHIEKHKRVDVVSFVTSAVFICPRNRNLNTFDVLESWPPILGHAVKGETRAMSLLQHPRKTIKSTWLTERIRFAFDQIVF